MHRSPLAPPPPPSAAAAPRTLHPPPRPGRAVLRRGATGRDGAAFRRGEMGGARHTQRTARPAPPPRHPGQRWPGRGAGGGRVVLTWCGEAAGGGSVPTLGHGLNPALNNSVGGAFVHLQQPKNSTVHGASCSSEVRNILQQKRVQLFPAVPSVVTGIIPLVIVFLELYTNTIT